MYDSVYECHFYFGKLLTMGTVCHNEPRFLTLKLNNASVVNVLLLYGAVGICLSDSKIKMFLVSISFYIV